MSFPPPHTTTPPPRLNYQSSFPYQFPPHHHHHHRMSRGDTYYFFFFINFFENAKARAFPSLSLNTQLCFSIRGGGCRNARSELQPRLVSPSPLRLQSHGKESSGRGGRGAGLPLPPPVAPPPPRVCPSPSPAARPPSSRRPRPPRSGLLFPDGSGGDGDGGMGGGGNLDPAEACCGGRGVGEDRSKGGPGEVRAPSRVPRILRGKPADPEFPVGRPVCSQFLSDCW